MTKPRILPSLLTPYEPKVIERPGCPPELLAEWLRHNQPTTQPEPVLVPMAPKKSDPAVVAVRGKSGPKFNPTSNMGMIRAILLSESNLTSLEILTRLRQLASARFAKTKATNIASWLAEARMRGKVLSAKSPEGMRWTLVASSADELTPGKS